MILPGRQRERVSEGAPPCREEAKAGLTADSCVAPRAGASAHCPGARRSSAVALAAVGDCVGTRDGGPGPGNRAVLPDGGLRAGP